MCVFPLPAGRTGELVCWAELGEYPAPVCSYLRKSDALKPWSASLSSARPFASHSRKLAAGVMTAGALRALCRDEGGPTTPSAVVALHCNCGGFERISEELSAYFELEILHLEKNHFERIENLERLTRLTCLNLQGAFCFHRARPSSAIRPSRIRLEMAWLSRFVVQDLWDLCDEE